MILLGLLLGLASTLFCLYCGVYAFNNELWYELFCVIGGWVLCLYCSYLFAISNKLVQNELK